MNKAPKWLSYGYLTLFAVLPWSVEAGFGAWSLSLPDEPLIAVLGIGLIYVLWQNPRLVQYTFSNNVFLYISFTYLVWMAVSACFSSVPIVSWKYWLVEMAHWWVFAVGISLWPDLWRKALPWFIFSVGGVAIYTLVHHGFYHFRTDQALLAPMPFFPDHTMWAAVLSMVLFLGSMAFRPSGKWAFTPINKSTLGVENGATPDRITARPPKITIAILMLLLLAFIFSTCRAAWVSVFLAAAVWCFCFLGKNGRLGFLGLLVIAGFCFGPGMIHSFGQDVSGQERLNRWNCAIRMAQEKPCLGFGLGTYQFQYIDFQKPGEMTRISLLAPAGARGPDTYGRGGGAHSEYLRILAETGWPGLLLWLSLVISAIVAGSVPATSVAGKPKTNQLPNPSIYLILALLTFFAHSAVNDFLHDGRISALFWGCMAMVFTTKKED